MKYKGIAPFPVHTINCVAFPGGKNGYKCFTISIPGDA